MLCLVNNQACVQGVADISAAFLLVQLNVLVCYGILLVLSQQEALHVGHCNNVIIGKVYFVVFASGVIVSIVVAGVIVGCVIIACVVVTGVIITGIVVAGIIVIVTGIIVIVTGIIVIVTGIIVVGIVVDVILVVGIVLRLVSVGYYYNVVITLIAAVGLN
jgi:hypothetical protein